MSEGITNIPPLNIPSEDGSSELDADSSERSLIQTNNNAFDSGVYSIISAESLKCDQDKPFLKPGDGVHKNKKIFRRTQKKRIIAEEFRSHIPHSILTTSESSSSVATVNSEVSTSAENSPCSLELLPTSTFEIQTSSSTAICLAQISRNPKDYTINALLNFNLQKSHSDINMREARRSGNFSKPIIMTSVPISQSQLSLNDNRRLANMQTSSNLGELTFGSGSLHSPTSMSVTNLQNAGASGYYIVLDENTNRNAGMKVYAAIMLNAWRKRRFEVKALTDEVDALKRGSIKAKNQLHVMNSLFRLEQKRNSDLNTQIKRGSDELRKAHATIEKHTNSIINLKANNSVMAQKLQAKEQELEGINAMVSETKSELFKSMTLERDLQASLSCIQRENNVLETQKLELMNQICSLNDEFTQRELRLASDLKNLNYEFYSANTKINELEAEIIELHRIKNEYVRKHEISEEKMKVELSNLQIEVINLRHCLAATLGSRLKACWANTMAYKRTTLHVLHWFAFAMLPAYPVPRISPPHFNFSIVRALDMIRR